MRASLTPRSVQVGLDPRFTVARCWPYTGASIEPESVGVGLEPGIAVAGLKPGATETDLGPRAVGSGHKSGSTGAVLDLCL